LQKTRLQAGYKGSTKEIIKKQATKEATKSMKTIQFPVMCSYRQFVYKQYRKKGNGLVVADDSTCTSFDAFNNPYLVPSLEHLIDSTPENRRQAAIKGWVSQYGFLTVFSYYSDISESFDDFWSEAQRFISLRQLYRDLLNCRLDVLQEVVVFKKWPASYPVWKSHSMLKPPFAEKLKSRCYTSEIPPVCSVTRDGLKSHGCDMYNKHATIEDINRDPLRYYQIAVFRYIAYAIEERLELAIRPVNRSAIADRGFKITPRLQPKNLLQALYLQLYLLLADRSKKICASCGRVFTPSRPDMRYCSDKCKKREKMRRYRARKKLEQKKEVVTNGW
jgi:hypothetical protein